MSFPHRRPKPRFSLFASDPSEPAAPKIRIMDRIKAQGRTIPGIKVTSFFLGVSGGILAAAMFKHSCSTSAKTLTADVTGKLDFMRRQLENGGGVPYSLQDEVSVNGQVRGLWSIRWRGWCVCNRGVIASRFIVAHWPTGLDFNLINFYSQEFVRASSQGFDRVQHQGLAATIKYHCQHGWNQGIEHFASMLNSIVER